MTPMETRSYNVKFLTPAFLGDAEQNGAWRTPPFKALLRQWWRVAVARRLGFCHQAIREEEGRLFGNAWLEANGDDRAVGRKSGHCRSQVRIRLESADGVEPWALGNQNGVAPMSSGIDTSYSWFGIINRKDRMTKTPLLPRSGIRTEGAEAERTLKLAFPESTEDRLDLTVRLLAGFGQVGSRARTGWGAVEIKGVKPLSASELLGFSRDLPSCLKLDWAHAFGLDDHGPLIWESDLEFKDWAAALTKVAALRKEVRTSLKGVMNLRPLLGFADAARMASPLRWRVFRGAPTDALKVRVFALPHRIPELARKEGVNRHADQAWSTVSGVLDRSWLRRIR